MTIQYFFNILVIQIMKKTVTLIVHGHRKLIDKSLDAIELMQNEPILTVNVKKTKAQGDAYEFA